MLATPLFTLKIKKMNLKELLKFESRKQYLTRKYRDMRNLDKFDRPSYWKKEPYEKIKNRILYHYVGKSFDEAFSHYCKHVPVEYKYLFLEEFEDPFSRWSEWHLDADKNIVHIKQDKYISKSEWREILRNKQEEI